MPKIIEIAALDITIYKFVVPLMHKLCDEGWEVCAAFNNTSYGSEIQKMGFRTFQIDFIRNLSPFKNLKALGQLIKLFKAEKPDIVHTHTPIASLLVRIASLFTKSTTVVYTIHGLNYKPPFLQVELFACRNLTDFIFTVNDEDCKYLAKRKIRQEKIKSLNGVGIDTDRFNRARFCEEETGKLKETFGLKEKPVIGFVGRTVSRKGFKEVVKAFIEVHKKRDCQLLIVGSASLGERDTETLGFVKELIKSQDVELVQNLQAQSLQGQRLQDDVIFTGQRDDIPELLTLMDIFVHPSYWEGMCVSTLEAMAMELPVIATDIRGIREEITEDTGFLVPVKNVEKIVSAMEILLDNPGKGKEMGRNGRERVLELFSQNQSVNVQIETFKKIGAK